MPASLLIATVRAALRAVDELPDLSASNSFITLFHANLEPESGRLTFVDAGHGLVFIQRCQGEVEPLRQHSVPLGVLTETLYPQGETIMLPADTLVIYSDGLPDTRPDLNLDPLGVVRELGALKHARAKLNRLVSLVDDILTRPDDITHVLVVVRREER